MLPSRQKLLIRAEAGPSIGTGHVMRMLALGKAWKKTQGEVAFVVGNLPHALVQRIEKAGVSLFRINDQRSDTLNAREIVEIARTFEPDWIGLAGNRLGEFNQRIIATARAKILIVDSPIETPFSCADLLVNPLSDRQTVHPSDRGESSISNLEPVAGRIGVRSRGVVLDGSEFALFGDISGVDHHEASKIYAQVRRIVVACASGDPDNGTIRTLEVLAGLNRKSLVVDCVAGTDAEQLAVLARFKTSSKLRLRIHRNVDRLCSLAQYSDLAITSSVLNGCELVRLAVPTVMVSSDRAGESIPKWLANSDAIAAVSFEGRRGQTSRSGLGTENTLSQQIASLMVDRERRKRMSVAGRQLFDGLGARRIADEMARFSVRGLKRSA